MNFVVTDVCVIWNGLEKLVIDRFFVAIAMDMALALQMEHAIVLLDGLECSVNKALVLVALNALEEEIALLERFVFL